MIDPELKTKKFWIFAFLHITSVGWMLYAIFIDPHPKMSGHDRTLRDIGAAFDSVGYWLATFFFDIIFQGPIWSELYRERQRPSLPHQKPKS